MRGVYLSAGPVLMLSNHTSRVHSFKRTEYFLFRVIPDEFAVTILFNVVFMCCIIWRRGTLTLIRTKVPSGI